MEILITPLSISQAKQYLHWQYGEPYTFYNTPEEYFNACLEEITQQLEHWFCISNHHEMIGIFEYTLHLAEIEIGLALRPDLTGKGLGLEFVHEAVQFCLNHYHLNHARFVMRVACFNQRAIKVYQRAGFTITEEYNHTCFNQTIPFYKMVKEI